MTRNVCVVTGSRSEYGLLRHLLFRLRDDKEISLQLVVTGSHLSDAFGNTQSEIENDGLNISTRIAIPMDGDSKSDMARSTGYAISAFTDCFIKIQPELLVILGDRYEIFAAATAAAILGIPIAHISGGDVTEGALDDTFRHCITKMSFLHFAGCAQSEKRIIQLGENPERVYNTGEPGVENCIFITPLSLTNLQQHITIDIMQKPYALVTFHAATKENESATAQVEELASALDQFPGMNFLITKANADAGGRAINRVWDELAGYHPNWLVIPSFGVRNYISAMKYAQMIIGNSSSGIVEAPTLKLPTVNIGERQKGRVMANSVICCRPVAKEIAYAIQKALSPEFREIAANTANPFGDGHTSKQIFDIIKNFLASNPDSPTKVFYDLR